MRFQSPPGAAGIALVLSAWRHRGPRGESCQGWPWSMRAGVSLPRDLNPEFLEPIQDYFDLRGHHRLKIRPLDEQGVDATAYPTLLC